MYNIKKRQVDIINYLIRLDDYITVDRIADRFDVSIRTIRYDLDVIAGWLEDNQAKLIKVSKLGIKIEIYEKKSILLEKINHLSVENRVLTDQEKVNQVLLYFLNSTKAITIDDICHAMYLSRNTVIKAVKMSKGELARYQLELEKLSGKGFSVKGKEENKRRLILDLFLGSLSYKNIIPFITNEDDYKELIELWNNYFTFFDYQQVKRIFNTLALIEKINQYFFADTSLTKLGFYLAISVHRMNRGSYIDNPLKRVRKYEEYQLAKLVSEELEDKLEVKFNSSEVEALTNYLLESKTFKSDDELRSTPFNDYYDDEIILWTMDIVEYFEKALKVNLKDDKQLMNGLALHMKSAIHRVRNGNQLDNGYLNAIKRRYPFVFQIARESALSIQKEMNTYMTDEEIGYIVLHIRAAYERLYNIGYSVTALVICNEGLAILSMLTTKLKQLLPEIRIIETCSIYDYEKHKEDIDLVITTGSFKLKDVDVIKVNPFLENEDVYKIRSFIIQYNKFKQIHKYNREEYDIGGKVVMIEDILFEDAVQLKQDVSNWEEAIAKAGELLVEQGHVTHGYIDNMINAVKDLGPYIVIMPGIAFAHARPDKTVINTCMSLITLREPVNFGSEANDPVHIVFAFAAKDENEHVKALQDIAIYLSVDENVEFLKQCEDKKEVIKNIVSK